MSDKPIACCLIVDDIPINASYWWRLQQTGFGFKPTDDIWGDQWRAQAPYAFNPPELIEQFADLVQEFGIRGKFTLVPCPAALGRLDESIRGYDDKSLAKLLDIVRSRIAPSFDITTETLTHSMGYELPSRGLRPHSETAWLSHLAETNRIDELAAYISLGYRVLRNIGFEPHGNTFGGMTDPSGVAAGKMLVHGYNIPRALDAICRVEREHYGDAVTHTFTFASNNCTNDALLPEQVFTSPTGVAGYSVFTLPNDPLAPMYNGEADISLAADALVSPDLQSGLMIETAEAGKLVAFHTHGQTMHSKGTFKGIKALRLAMSRLHERYGSRIQWHTTKELCLYADTLLAK